MKNRQQSPTCVLPGGLERSGDTGAASSHRGFSLMELLVVLAVTVILAALLMPALTKLRESVHRVVCSSGMRQVGVVAMHMYMHDYQGALPPSIMLSDPENHWEPSELMAVLHAEPSGWDGLGLLVHLEYCSAIECYFCPSHSGDHPLERYTNAWAAAVKSGGLEGGPIYTNRHYAGHRKWDTGFPRFVTAERADSIALVTDGLRTATDFNHNTGANVAWADGSVRWREDLLIKQLLPESDDGEEPLLLDFSMIWQRLEAPQSIPTD